MQKTNRANPGISITLSVWKYLITCNAFLVYKNVKGAKNYRIFIHF